MIGGFRGSPMLPRACRKTAMARKITAPLMIAMVMIRMVRSRESSLGCPPGSDMKDCPPRNPSVARMELKLGFGRDGFPVVHHSSPQNGGRVERPQDFRSKLDGDRAAIPPGGNRDGIGTDAAN